MQLTRNRYLRRGAAAGLALMVSGGLAGTSSAATRPPNAPHVPAGFSKQFTSRFVNAGGLRQHIVIGGDGRHCCSCTAGPRTGTSTGR